MYVVLYDFTDMQDGHHLYRSGDNFPRNGFEVKPDRINELKSSSNRQGRPLIEEMKNSSLKGEKADTEANAISQSYSEKKDYTKRRNRRKTE